MNGKQVKHLLWLIILFPLLAGCSRKHEPTIAPFISDSDNLITAQAESFTYNECPFKIPNDMPPDMLRNTQCATLTVPEDWLRPEGSTIELAVAVVKASSDTPKQDPILVFIGSAGFGLDFAYALPYIFETLSEERDFIVVDQRGTGYSQPSLTCTGLENLTYDPTSEFSLKQAGDQFVEISQTCANSIKASGVTLSAYTTSAMAADMEALRQALGISQWNILTLLNGSRLALAMMRDYPQGIRSVVMDSVVPLQANPAAEWGVNAMTTLDRFFERCAQDDKCNQAFPRIQETFYSLLDQIDAQPIEMDVSNLSSGRRTKIMLDSERLLTFLLGMLNTVDNSQNLGEVPRMIYQLRDGKTEAATRLMGENNSINMPPSALNLWLECNEEMKFITLDQVKQANLEINVPLQRYFNTQAEINLNICEPWKAVQASGYENLAVSSSIPTLMLSGEFNWSEPPAWAEKAAATLRNATAVEFSGSGQIVYVATQWSDCSHRIVDAFIETPSSKPNTGCASGTSKITWITLP
jgi:pimeloyl-ACP methyl ester carboxylesterase